MESGKTSFVMYCRYATAFERLNGEEVKKLMLAIFKYVEHGEVPDFNDNAGLDMAFAVISDDLNRDGIKWQEAKQKMSEAGKKGMATRWGNK